MINLGFLQFSPVYKDPDTNLDRIVILLQGCGDAIMVLPELCLTGYDLDKQGFSYLGEDLSTSNRLEFIASLCKELNLKIVLGFAERDGDNLYNSAAFVTPQGIKHVYRKAHLFHKEKGIFDRGDTGFHVIVDGGVSYGILLCYDWAFPEAARTLAFKGAEVILHPANLVLPYGQRAMRTRSLENRVFTVTANRVGTEGDLIFTGRSQIVDVSGDILASFDTEEEGAQVVKINPQDAMDKWLTKQTCETDGNNLFNDRRPDLYK